MTSHHKPLFCLLLLFVTAPVWSQTAPAKPVLQSPLNQEPAYPELYPTFKWTAGANATGESYDFYLGTDAAHLQLLAENTANEYFNDSVIVLLINDTFELYYFNMLQRKTSYYWKLVARNNTGNTTESDVWSFTTGSPNLYPPEIPANPFPANNVPDITRTPLLKWGKVIDPDEDEVEYDLYLSESSAANTLVAAGLTDTSFKINTPLKGNTAWYWKIVAKDKGGKETTGPVWKFTTANTPPPPVTLSQPGQQAVNVDYNTSFAWQKAVDADADSVYYEFWYGTGTQPDRMLVTANTTITLSLAAAATYQWKVIAIDSHGGRSESALWNFTTRSNAGNTAPLPFALQAPANNSTGILLQQTLQWDATTDNDQDAVSYAVYIGDNPSQLNLVATALTTTQYSPALQASTTYYWKIVATDGKGGYTESPTWQFSMITEDIGLSNLRVYYRFTDATQLYRYEPSALSPAFQVTTSTYSTKGKTTIKDAVAILLDYSNPNTIISFELPPGFTATTPVIYNAGLPAATKSYMISGTFAKHNTITVHLQAGAATRSYTIDAQVNEIPGKPVPDQPVNDQTGLSVTPTLSWTGGDDPDGNTVIYRVFIGTSTAQLQSRALLVNQKSYTLTSPLLGNQRYYWKITALDTDGESSESEINSFVTAPTTTQLLTPVPEYPREISTYVETSPTLVWRKVQDPSATYDVFIGYSNQLVRIAQGITDTSFPVRDLLPDTTYYWKVLTNVQGQTISSALRQFITKPAGGNKTGIVTDTRDGQIYEWVNINGQEWMTHNLAYVPQEKDGYYGYEYWKGVATPKGYVAFNSNNANTSKYGYLYNWEGALNFDAITDTTAPVQGVCPCGWHVATADDWQKLYPVTSDRSQMIHYSNWGIAGKEKVWLNRSGLSILPAGFWNIYSGSFEDKSYQVWLAQNYRKTARFTGANWIAGQNNFFGNNNTLYGAASVRCVRNTPGNHPPAAPVLLSPATNSQQQAFSISLQWMAAGDPDGDAVTYDILVDTLPAPVQVRETSFTTTTYTCNNLLAGKTYYWQVRARDSHGETAISAVFSFTTQANAGNTAPAAVALLQPAHQSTGVATTPATLQWAAATDINGDAITYTVYVGRQQGTLQPVATNITTTSCQVNNLLNGITYQWKVIASDGQGGLSASGIQTFTTLNQAPTVPVLLTPANGLQGLLTGQALTWQPCTDPDGDPVTYKFLWGSSPSNMIVMSESPNTYYNFGSSSLMTNTLRYWQVIATDGKGGETASAIRSYTTYRNLFNTPVALVSPANYSENQSLNPKLVWQKVTSPGYTYDVYVGDGTGQSLLAAGLTDTFYAITQYRGLPGLQPNSYYIWTIVAKDAIGNINTSDTWRLGTLNAQPDKPILITPSAGATNIPVATNLSWTMATDPDNDLLAYDLYVDTNPAATTLLASGVQNGSYALSQLTPGATYYWKIVVNDAHGGAVTSDISSFTIENNGQNHAPAAPLLSSPAIFESGVTSSAGFHWQAAHDIDGDALVYDLYFGTSSSLATPLATNLSTLQFALPVLTNGITYYWKVIARDGRGGETASSVWNFTAVNNAPSAPLLQSPANGTILTGPSTQLTWSAATDVDNDPLVYDVYLDKAAQPAVRIASGLTTLSYTTPAIDNNVVYYWKVVARDPLGAEAASSVYSITGRNEAPSAPVLNLPADNSAHTAETATLSWNASTDADSDPIAYEVYIGSTPATLQKAGTVYTTSFTTTALTINTVYYWKIVAKDQQQATAASATWSFNQQVMAPNQPPAAPALLTPANQASDVNAQQVNFNWAGAVDPDGDPVTYDLYLGTDAQAATKIAGPLTTVTHFINDLTANTTYYWKVTASDNQGNQQASTVYTFTTAPPPVPTGTNDPELDRQIKIFPNPTTGPLIIQLPASLEDWYLELYDSKGGLIYSRKVNSGTRQWRLQLTHKGLYLLRINKHHRTVVKKLMAY